MEINGYITDAVGHRLKGTAGIVSADGKAVLAFDDTGEDGSYLLNPQAGEYIYVAAPGFITKILPAQSAGGRIVLNRPVNLTAVALVASIAYPLLFAKKARGVGKLNFDFNDVKTVAWIVGGVLAFDIVAKILKGLGLWKDENERVLDTAASDPNSFWNPNFWKKSQSYSYAIDTPTAERYVETIHDAFGLWNDDEAAIINVIHQMRTKANISFLSYIYSTKYGKDLFEALRSGDGFSAEGLSDAELASLNNYGNSLPNF